MSCYRTAFGIVTVGDCYRFGGMLFEWHSYLGPTLMSKRTGEPRKTIPKGFWDVIEEFQKLTPKEREQYRI